MHTCHACRRELSINTSVGRRDVCPHCRADLHCCLNCGFYDAKAPKQCREPIADLVKEKGRANFCDYFVYRESRADEQAQGEAEQSRKALNDLFKK